MGTTLKVAACQMQANIGDISENLTRSERLMDEAFEKGAKWVIVPEFFPTAIAFHPSMMNAAMPLEGQALKLLQDAARRHHGYVGGSFIAIRGNERYNTFVLVQPDGSYATHDKDMPTIWEGCYYRGGSDDGILPIGSYRVGAILCWEFIRWQTARRLLNKVDFVVGGSCWPSYPNLPIFKTLLAKDAKYADHMMQKTFPRMAKILGVPIVHASHAGLMKGKFPMLGLPYDSFFLGETQIIDGKGNVLAKLGHSDGEGVVLADIELGQLPPSEPIEPDAFWIPKMPLSLKLTWSVFNWHARRYYQNMKQKGIY